jgi:hypothetical protein
MRGADRADRVLRIADEDMSEAARQDMAEWTGCIGAALTPAEFERGLTEAGLEQVDIVEAPRPPARGIGDYPRSEARVAAAQSSIS